MFSSARCFIRLQTCVKNGCFNLTTMSSTCRTATTSNITRNIFLNPIQRWDSSKCFNSRWYSAEANELKYVPMPILTKRVTRKKKPGEIPGHWNVTAFATAQEYDLENLKKGIVGKDLYEIVQFDESVQNDVDSFQVIAKYQVGSEPRFIYFFKEGSLVAWNVSDLEIENLLEFLKQYERKPYDKEVVLNEKEFMNYTYSPNGKVSQLKRDRICLVENDPEDTLCKYTISNAMALSVKLGVWEAALDKYVDSIEYITEDLQSGKKISISRQEVLKRTGQLFSLRHSINLGSDLLDTPDFYWDREDLENLYLQTCNYYSISRRTKVMNEKLNHCLELVDLLSSHLSDKHHIRLEWMIIVLIMIEVAFEAIHYSHLLIWPFAFTEYVLPEIKPM
ncbi:hypothetical protein WDU94_001384 [Cyamophila willieti]